MINLKNVASEQIIFNRELTSSEEYKDYIKMFVKDGSLFYEEKYLGKKLHTKNLG